MTALPLTVHLQLLLIWLNSLYCCCFGNLVDPNIKVTLCISWYHSLYIAVCQYVYIILSFWVLSTLNKATNKHSRQLGHQVRLRSLLQLITNVRTTYLYQGCLIHSALYVANMTRQHGGMTISTDGYQLGASGQENEVVYTNAVDWVHCLQHIASETQTSKMLCI